MHAFSSTTLKAAGLLAIVGCTVVCVAVRSSCGSHVVFFGGHEREAAEEELREAQALVTSGTSAPNVEARVSGSDDAVLEWAASMNAADRADVAQVAAAGAKLYDTFARLWGMTGECLFSDMSDPELTRQAATILDEYSRLVWSRREAFTRETAIASVERNIDLLAGVDWWPALWVLQQQIAFDRPIVIAGYLRRSPFEREWRVGLRDQFRKWWDSNRQSVVWHADRGQFEPNTATTLPVGQYVMDRLSE